MQGQNGQKRQSELKGTGYENKTSHVEGERLKPVLAIYILYIHVKYSIYYKIYIYTIL